MGLDGGKPPPPGPNAHTPETRMNRPPQAARPRSSRSPAGGAQQANTQTTKREEGTKK